MWADFWAGYISGAVGIVIGNPLDVLKVRLQAAQKASKPAAVWSIPPGSSSSLGYLRPWVTGIAAPVLGYGALNALLFVSYNRSEAGLNRALHIPGGAGSNLWTTWIAGAIGGLATCVISTPTELVKCRSQLACPPMSSWAITKQVVQAEGVRGLYLGGVVTLLRESIGYGFYFWSYELGMRCMNGISRGHAFEDAPASLSHEAARVLLCGGIAGVVTWASIFPLDVVKTRVQTQVLPTTSYGSLERVPLCAGHVRGVLERQKRSGAWKIAKYAYREGGVKPFFRGLAVCSLRAFLVNAAQWCVYEGIMFKLGQGRLRRSDVDNPDAG